MPRSSTGCGSARQGAIAYGANNDMADLRARLEEAREARFKLIATDGVFSMDGICRQPEKASAISRKSLAPW